MQVWQWVLLVGGLVGGGVAALILMAGPLRRSLEARQVREGLARFKTDREQLEARFFDVASRLGKPRGLRWIECDWLSEVAFAREQNTGFLTAFVAVNIRFEAIAGGDMEDVAAVGNVRDASAVFHFNNGAWGTGGRALFNMNPAVAVDLLQPQYTPIQI